MPHIKQQSFSVVPLHAQEKTKTKTKRTKTFASSLGTKERE